MKTQTDATDQCMASRIIIDEKDVLLMITIGGIKWKELLDLERETTT